MIEMSLGEIADIVDGTLGGGADPATMVSAPMVFDSRAVRPGGLFLALPGERADGHDFAPAAVAAGAVAAVVTRPVEVAHILVADGVQALAALASAVARRLTDTVIVGLTGSSGKTSTKDLIAGLLERLGPTVAPAGSFNNELGHPSTVLTATADTRHLVLEMGARGVGHIRYLTDIAQPHVGVVLNVGSAHLGEFGSREIIAQAKGELVEALPSAGEGGLAVLNADDHLVLAMAARTSARVVTFGESAAADVRALDVTLDDLGRPGFTLHVRGERATVRLGLVGEHHVSNALAAAAVAAELGLGVDEIAAALGEAVPRSRWRMEITERPDGVVIINDAYNANPESMRAALKTLAFVGRSRQARTIAVLGQMAELGEDSLTEHDAIGRLAVRLDISRLIAVGDPARPIANGAALEGSWDGESSWVPDAPAAIAAVRELMRPGDIVLVKASRAASLERVALALGEDEPPTPSSEEAAQ